MSAFNVFQLIDAIIHIFNMSNDQDNARKITISILMKMVQFQGREAMRGQN